jgi:hypothetical protein
MPGEIKGEGIERDAKPIGECKGWMSHFSDSAALYSSTDSKFIRLLKDHNIEECKKYMLWMKILLMIFLK